MAQNLHSEAIREAIRVGVRPDNVLEIEKHFRGDFMAVATQTQGTGSNRLGNTVALSVIAIAFVIAGLIFYVMTHTTRSNMGNVQTSAASDKTPTEKAIQTTGESRSGSDVGTYQNSGTSGTYTPDRTNTEKPVGKE